MLQNRRQIKIGLTGGIGAGKTFVAEVFPKLGIPVFNADIEAKKCMQSNVGLIKKIKEAFGDDIYVGEVLQKEKLASIIFNDSNKLQLINELVHPVVKNDFENWCANQKSEIVIKEAAILFESSSHVGLDKVICVSADETTRVKRVQQRDNTTVDQIKSRINKQMHQDEKEELSDFVIVNDGKQLILPQVLEILSQIN